MEYISRIDVLLEASLSREALAEDDKKCRHCTKNNWAVWRCRDCSMGDPMCRSCIRQNHKDDPFHRIEHWNGSYFRPADLSEVGTYLLVRHHTGIALCHSLKDKQDFLEMSAIIEDNAEQEKLDRTSISHSVPSGSAFNRQPTIREDDQRDTDFEMGNDGGLLDDEGDEEFFRLLKEHQDGGVDGGVDGQDGTENVNCDDSGEVDDDAEDVESGAPIPKHFLPNNFNADFDIGTGSGFTGGGSTQHSTGTYVRVVHTNGIHIIAMISCECQGHDSLPSDLVAARLMPTSFERIQTLFTGQLLDLYRLSNLELKATAYQFYHLLQRLTSPLNPSEVLDLYKELRRMSRIWRWMKRLKWAGYGDGHSKAADITPGELTIFCPACPQPNINIPENWKEDSARYVLKNIMAS